MHDPRLLQISVYDLVNLEARETGAIPDAAWAVAMNTLQKQAAANAVRANGSVAFSRFFGEAARMGRADLVDLCLAKDSYFRETGPYPCAGSRTASCRRG